MEVYMMARKNRTPEEKERRAKIRELLQSSNISSMDDIQNLFKDTIAEFMENGLDAELDEELGYSKYTVKHDFVCNHLQCPSTFSFRWIAAADRDNMCFYFSRDFRFSDLKDTCFPFLRRRPNPVQQTSHFP